MLASALDVPIFGVITMVDACTDARLSETLAGVETLLRRDGHGEPRVIRTDADLALLGPNANGRYARAVTALPSTAVHRDRALSPSTARADQATRTRAHTGCAQSF